MAASRDGPGVLKGTPRPKGAPPRVPKGSVQDALESLEKRRRKAPVKVAKTQRDDLDLDAIR
ncbi:MAG: hypothetical protein QOJ26_1850 [Thermoplasmata archaeon]|jgi:hypothetical protein|nr:hypothetical protein [Thermoplasmata archaeon]MEA3166966.1 hypothetical protein [Thermoplasmata archaeon]